jgi:hypothetical protein
MALKRYTGTLTCTLASLADAAARQSAALSLEAGGGVLSAGEVALNAWISVQVQAGTTPDSKAEVYAAAEMNGNWQDGATGSDAAFTASDIDNLPLLGVIDFDDTADAIRMMAPASLRDAFAGAMPDQVSVVVLNESGAAFNAAATEMEVYYVVEAWEA